MKSRQLLSLLLGSTLIFTAGGQETKKTEDTKSEEKKAEPSTESKSSETASEKKSSEVKDAEALVTKAQEKSGYKKLSCKP